MLKWVEPFIWMACRVLAFIFQFIGLTGILMFVLIAIWNLAEVIE